MKKKLTKKKKTILIIFILIIFFIILFKIKNPSKIEQEEKIEMANIEKRNIAKSISATGIINTTNSKDFVSNLTGMKFATINVKEGDKINSGDIICTFDTSSIEKNLSIAQSNLNVTQAQANLGVQTSERNLNDAINNRNTQVSTTQTDVDTAKKAYDDAQNQLNSSKNTLEQQQNQLKNYSITYNKALEDYSKVKSEYDIRENTYKQAENSYNAQLMQVQNAKIVYDKYFKVNGDSVVQIAENGSEIKQSDYKAGNYATQEHQNADLNYTNEQNMLKQLEINLNTANNNFLNYKLTYENAQNTFTPVQTQYEALAQKISATQATVANLEATVNNLKVTYDKTVTALNSTVSAANSTIASARDALTNSELAANSASLTQQGQINAYKEQIEDGKVISTVSGTVTSVNFKAGDLYTGTTIATVEGSDELIIEAEIDEYDIPDVKVGMKVLIKTDATREEELEGTVTYVSSSATKSNSTMTTMSAISSNATYKIQISLNSQNDRLRLGMNAKLSIITEMKENVWSVPYDSVYDREDGTSYIEVAKDDSGENKEELTVQKGIEGSYYVEIMSDKLKEGMKVILPKVDTGNSIESLIEMMGPDAGI